MCRDPIGFCEEYGSGTEGVTKGQQGISDVAESYFTRLLVGAGFIGL